MTKRPERIKVVSKRFTVEYHKPIEGEEERDPALLDPEHAGECRTLEQRILIEDGMKPDTQKDTILHEVLHAISDEMELDLSEEQVTGAAKGILCVLMDNPSFARYLLRKG